MHTDTPGGLVPLILADEPLFDLPDVGEPRPELSAGQRLTIRQSKTLALGWHPLGARLHAEAAPHDDRTAEGRRCGNCRFRTPDGQGGTAGKYPKCWYGWDGTKAPPRYSHGPATDCRAWWPACADHVWGDVRLSPDAARHVPVGA